MFDFVQKNNLFIKVILGAIAVTFVGFGVGSYTAVLEEPYVAKVGDERITSQDIDQILAGRAVDELTRRQILEGLIQQRLLLVDAKQSGFVVTPEKLRAAIAAVPAFQENGSFNLALYQNYLRARNLDANAFEREIEAEILLQTQVESLGRTGFTSKYILEHLNQLLSQVRQVSTVVFQPEQYLRQVTVSDAAIDQFYKDNPTRFMQAEAVKLQYVEIDLDALASEISVSDQVLRSHFDSHREEFAREERKLSHILFALNKDASEETRAGVRAKAQQVLAEIQASPDRFEALAKEHSQDLGSAKSGGDLGLVTRGMMVEAFEKAAFALPEGGISELVETPFGLHIIRVLLINRPTFETVKDQVLVQLQRQQANRVYRQKIEELGELAYQNPKELTSVAEALKTQIKTSDWLLREGTPESPLAQEKLLEAVFSDDVLQQKNNTEAIEIASGKTVIARIAEHRPASRLPLESVRSTIRRELALKSASELAKKEGAAALATLKRGETAGLTWEPLIFVSRAQAQGLSPTQLKWIFSVPTNKVGTMAAHVGGELPNGAYVIHHVLKQTQIEAKDEEKSELMQRLNELYAADETVAFVSSLYRKIPVSIAATNAE